MSHLVPVFPPNPTDIYEVITAIFTAVAGLAALASTFMALWFYRDQKRSSRSERLSRYYDKMIATPVMQALDVLKMRTSELVGPAVEDITKLCEVDAGQNAVRSRVKKLVEDFDKEFRTLREIVSTVIGAWKDSNCNNALRRELESLEDSVKDEMARLAMDQTIPDPRKAVVAATARFYAAILAHDPASSPVEKEKTKKKKRLKKAT